VNLAARLESAIHEASHGVAALALGYTFTGLVISSDGTPQRAGRLGCFVGLGRKVFPGGLKPDTDPDAVAHHVARENREWSMIIRAGSYGSGEPWDGYGASGDRKALDSLAPDWAHGMWAHLVEMDLQELWARPDIEPAVEAVAGLLLADDLATYEPTRDAARAVGLVTAPRGR
jgi:hypothetical protein